MTSYNDIAALEAKVWELEEDYSICKHSLERAKSNILAKNALITASRQRGQELEVELARVNEIYDQIELRALMAKDAFDRKRPLLERLEENFNELCRERDTFRKQVERLVEVLKNLVALVRGKCPSLLEEDSGGNFMLSIEIDEVLSVIGQETKERP